MRPLLLKRPHVNAGFSLEFGGRVIDMAAHLTLEYPPYGLISITSCPHSVIVGLITLKIYWDLNTSNRDLSKPMPTNGNLVNRNPVNPTNLLRRNTGQPSSGHMSSDDEMDDVFKAMDQSSPVRLTTTSTGDKRPRAAVDDEDQSEHELDTTETNAAATSGGALNQNTVASVQRFVAKKRLCGEQQDEVTAFLKDPPALREAKLYVQGLFIENMIGKILVATPPWAVSPDLNKNIYSYGTAIRLSTQLSAYKGNIPKQILYESSRLQPLTPGFWPTQDLRFGPKIPKFWPTPALASKGIIRGPTLPSQKSKSTTRSKPVFFFAVICLCTANPEMKRESLAMASRKKKNASRCNLIRGICFTRVK
ncbi:hypothetical protein B0H10DRAFT_1960153 [Mycena sp. CBHHK59/15]|nr:hypothetical protein B0H10DRAFT_1960153 [Mycena sp. CBHHK59/15]